jgi:hypothetical protein
MQPGFLEMNKSSASVIGWAFRKNREVAWDGTMGMPVLPLADTQHKDGGKYYSF